MFSLKKKLHTCWALPLLWLMKMHNGTFLKHIMEIRVGLLIDVDCLKLMTALMNTKVATDNLGSPWSFVIANLVPPHEEWRDYHQDCQDHQDYQEYYQEWQDYQMQWNKTTYGGVESIRIHPKLMWTPDLLMYNRWYKSSVDQSQRLTDLGANLSQWPWLWQSFWVEWLDI